MTKYHAHELIVATGPGEASDLPDVTEFALTLPEPLRPMLSGPVQAPSSIDGRFATYVFLPDGEDSWHGSGEFDGARAHERFVAWLTVRLPGFDVVRLQFGRKLYSDEGRYDPYAEYVDGGDAS